MRKILWMVGLFLNSFAFAQLSEDFSDGEIAYQPTWMGDTGRFNVNVNNQIQSKTFFRGDTAYLATASTYNLNTVWEFYVQMNFDPSTGNLFRYYFTSDNVILNQSLKGYYLQIGESGSTDSYDFYRQTNSSSSKIIDGAAKARAVVDTLKTFIRMVHDKDGYWYLYSRAVDSTNWVLEGSVYDVTHQQSSYSGIYIRHTSTRSDKFIFDDLNIQQDQIDTTAPSLVFSSVLNDSTISIEYNEVLDTSNVRALNGYVLNNIIHPNNIIFNNYSNTIEIVFSGYLPNGNNILTMPFYKDIYGNQQSINDSFVFQYTMPVLSNAGDIIITEIMADPSPVIAMPNVEYLEIYNTSSKVIPLNGFTISDGTSTSVLGNYSIGIHEFVILCKLSDTGLFSQYGKVLGLSVWPTLNNTSDVITLKNAKNETIDQVTYDLTWYKDALKRDGGYSLERVDFTNQCSAFYNWMASASQNGGTPGQINSYWIETHENKIFKINHVLMKTDSSMQIQFNHIPDTALAMQEMKYRLNGFNIYAKKTKWVDENYHTLELIYGYKFNRKRDYKLIVGNVITCEGVYLEENFFTVKQINIDDTSTIRISELMIDPYPSVALPNLEYVEIYNQNNYDVELINWKIGYNNNDYIIPNKKLLANSYYIICNIKDTLTLSEFGNTIGIIGFPTMSNTSARISLKNNKSIVIDEVTYHIDWHSTNTKKLGGWSLEQIDPFSKCNAQTNWSSSNDGSGGTPGYENSIKNFYSDAIDLKVTTIKNTSNKIFEVKFNKNFNSVSINPAQFYYVKDQQHLFFPDSIKLNTPYTNSVKMYFSNALTSGLYQLVCHSLSYCGRNDTNVYYKLQINEQSENDEIVITELMIDPSPSQGLPLAEYIEIQNRGADQNDVQLEIYDRKNVAGVLIDSIKSGQYLVLTDISNKDLWTDYEHVIFVEDMPSLHNTSDSIYLKLKESDILDSVFYDLKQWHEDYREGGYALELSEGEYKCKSNLLWGNGIENHIGSPGKANLFKASESSLQIKVLSEKFEENKYELQFNQTLDHIEVRANVNDYLKSIQIEKDKLILEISDELATELLKIDLSIHTCLGMAYDTMIYIQFKQENRYEDILINEVLFNAYAGSSDFIELYNNSGRAINLRGFVLQTKDQQNQVVDSTIIFKCNYFMMPHEYLVLTEDKQSVMMNYRSKDKDKIVEINKLIKMSDKDGNVYLFDETGKAIDAMQYSEAMHLSWLEDIDGRSLERRMFDRSAMYPDNWSSASDDVGKASPGLQNSQSSYQLKDSNKDFYLSKKLISPNADGFSDMLELNYHLKNTSMVIRVNVFDQQGRYVANIFNDYSISNSGVLTWDMTQNQVKIQNGLYLIFIEGLSDTGSYKKYKLPFIVDDN